MSWKENNYGRNHKDYFAHSESEICVIVQVEQQMSAGEESTILNVEGVGLVFIGPSGISVSMGHFRNSSLMDVHENISQIFDAVVAKFDAVINKSRLE